MLTKIPGQTNWLRDTEIDLFGEGNGNIDNTGSMVCGVLGAKCEPGLDWQCDQYFDKSPDKYECKMGYWVYRAIRVMHDNLELLQDEIRDKTIINGFQTEDMVKEFDATEEHVNVGSMAFVLNWVASTFLTAGAVYGLTNPVVGTTGVVVGLLFSRVAGDVGVGEAKDKAKSDEPVNIGRIKSILAEHFEKKGDELKQTARLAVGEDLDGVGFDKLPSMAFATTENDFTTTSSIAKFFSTPFWLLDINSNTVKEVIDTAGIRIRWKLIDTILQTVGWAVMGDQEIKDQGACDKTRGQWMDVEGTTYCLNLWWNDNGNWRKAAEDTKVYSGMEKFGMLGQQEYYRQCLRCAKAGRSGTTDVTVPDGVGSDPAAMELPECLLSAPVKWRSKQKTTISECATYGIGSCYDMYKITDWYS